MKNKKIFCDYFRNRVFKQSLQKGEKAGCTSEEKEKLLKLNKKLKKVLTKFEGDDKIKKSLEGDKEMVFEN